MINKKEANIALFALIVAIANVFLIIFGANRIILSIFSFAMSIGVMYFAWRELEQLDIIKQIKLILAIGAIEKDIVNTWQDSVEAVKNAPNEFETEDR
jgi:hypothetical protein